MKKAILGKKLGMSQVFANDGSVIPVTIIEAGPCYVTQVKNKETDGYEAVQMAFGEIKAKNVNKCQTGAYKKAGVEPKRTMKEYKLDGLKVDFLDQIHPNVDDPRAEACYNFTAELAKRIRNVKKDAMIEFRQSYAVPRMLACGTQFRAGDAPFDFLLNLRRIAQIRLALGDGVPVHADPAYWPADELPVNISRHFIAMMAGVPMLSVELADLSAEAEAICRFWIAFYKRHAAWLAKAHWEFDYTGGQLGSAVGSFNRSSLAIVCDPCRVPELPTDGWILNMSYAPVTVPGAEVFDWQGNPVAGDTIPEGCGAFVKR